MTDSTYRLYRNVSAPFTAYRSGARLWFDPTAYEVADLPFSGDAVQRSYDENLLGDSPRALDLIFARHNRDDRPDGQLAPSLSVGDLIALDWGNERTRFFSVDSFGFTEVEGPYLTAVINNGLPWDGCLPESAGWSEARVEYGTHPVVRA